MAENWEALGVTVLRERKKLGWTREQLAEVAEVSSRTIGTCSSKLWTLLRAAERRTTMYDPGLDLAVRYPDFRVMRCPIPIGHGATVLNRRLILISDEYPRCSVGERVTVAHEVVHLDLGHLMAVNAVLEARQERQTNAETARRLIELEDFADALMWANSDRELAEALHVDLETLYERKRRLTPDEVEFIDERLQEKEQVA